MKAISVIQIFLVIPWSVPFPIEDVRAPNTPRFQLKTCAEAADLRPEFVEEFLGLDDGEVHDLDDQSQELYGGTLETYNMRDRQDDQKNLSRRLMCKAPDRNNDTDYEEAEQIGMGTTRYTLHVLHDASHREHTHVEGEAKLRERELVIAADRVH